MRHRSHLISGILALRVAASYKRNHVSAKTLIAHLVLRSVVAAFQHHTRGFGAPHAFFSINVRIETVFYDSITET